MIDTNLSTLEQHVLGRSSSIFDADLLSAADELSELIAGSNVLLIGGAGSIGSRTLHTILQFRPRLVHVIDHNENGLAELVRGLRSSPNTFIPDEFLTLPFDFGGDPFRLWMAANSVDYDFVLSFAALKHVRSEKDPFSVLAMLETNVLHLDNLAGIFSNRRPPRRVFSVSTDKAANPSSMMGATKRLMEHAMFSPTHPWHSSTEIASARFANVAFSNGSLLQSWEVRLASGQPLACPKDCRRFFVSLGESGHLCTLAGFVGRDHTIAIPALDPADQLVLLSDVASKFLEHHGLEADFVDDPAEALGGVEQRRRDGRWPVLLTPLDTGGEKPYEEFVGDAETVQPGALHALNELDYLPPEDPTSFAALIDTTRSILQSRDASIDSLDDLRELISRVEPSFSATHRASDKSLDQRM